jgi:site-specific recombinase XerD
VLIHARVHHGGRPSKSAERQGCFGDRAAGRAPASLESVSAHRLRHTAATELLRCGASLPEVGQVLRHASLLNTALYAKVDHVALSTVARPWPVGAQ